MVSLEKVVSNAASRLRSCRDSAAGDWRRTIGSPCALRAALTYLLTHLRQSARAFAAEFGARCAINHLQSLDGDRWRDLGLERDRIERFVRFGRTENKKL